MRTPPGRQTLVAERPGYARQSVETVLSGGRGARVDFSLAVTEPERVAVANSADRLVLWTACEQLIGLSEGELRRWIARGVDGFVCQTNQLAGMGREQRFSARARAGGAHRLQRRLRTSPAVRLARRGRLIVYLGFKTVNIHNKRTPLVDWFDDRAWSREVLPKVRGIAAAARSMGLAGVAVDQELYPQAGGAETATWSWRYPGSRRSEADVRAKVNARGRQLMTAMSSAFPGLELVAYDTQLPRSWAEKVQQEVNESPNAYADDVRIDLWDGLSSVPRYSAIRWLDAIFYKAPHLRGASWEDALQYNAGQIYSFLSQRFSNWSYASSRLHVTPFSWIDNGPAGAFDRARGPGYVAEQLEAFNRWGTGGVFANYAYRALDDFDYGPYEDGLKAASAATLVDRSPPEVRITSPPERPRSLSAGEQVRLEGVANDDYAIRAVRWYDDRGRHGVARVAWEHSAEDDSGWNAEVTWVIDDLEVASDARRLTISAEDIKGLAAELKFTVE